MLLHHRRLSSVTLALLNYLKMELFYLAQSHGALANYSSSRVPSLIRGVVFVVVVVVLVFVVVVVVVVVEAGV